MLSIKQKPIIQNTNSLNHAQKPALGQAGLSQARFQCHDIISFKKSEGPSQKTIDYINQVRKGLEAKGEKLESLSQLDLDKIPGIANGIDIFKDWTQYDLALVSSSFEGIHLQHGCPHNCTHCGASALLKIDTMNWKNFEAITNGLGELKNRLGFNIFSIPGASYIYPFQDSDPMLFRSSTTMLDETRKEKTIYKNIFDAAKLFYDKTATKFEITTAGWNPKNRTAQEAAEMIVKAPKPKPIISIQYTISPFNGIVEEAISKFIEAEETINPEKKLSLQKEAFKKIDLYTEMVSENLVTLSSYNQLSILGLYDVNDNKYHSNKFLNFIFDKILDKIEKKIKEMDEKGLIGEDQLVKYDYSKNHFTQNTLFSQIGYIGRANNFAPDKNKSQQAKEDEYLEKVLNQGENGYQEIYKSPFSIDIDGSIVANLFTPEDKKREGKVLHNDIRLTGKKLTLPETQTLKTERNLHEIPWPNTEQIKKILESKF